MPRVVTVRAVTSKHVHHQKTLNELQLAMHDKKKLTIYANIAYMQTIFTMGKLHVYNPHHETVSDQKSNYFEWHDCMCKQRNKPIWFNTNKITMSTDVNIYHRYQFFVISTRLIWMYVFISTFCLAQHRWLSHSCSRYCLINQLPQ